ncbi:MAG: hypothetical protein GKR94_22885 [Gammaproteobacteria bacterium]|nr:hypothetical protein [Gammaproteobacteria bacterium]
MDKSQLRRLALDYAQGEVDHDSYVRERTELIDAIVSGTVAIEREPPPAPPTPYDPTESTLSPSRAMPAAHTPLTKRLSPLHTVVGGVIIAIIAAVFISSLSHEEPQHKRPVKHQPVQHQTVEVAKPPAAPEPVAKALVGRFLEADDWSVRGVADFMNEWRALKESERQDALIAPWFLSLSTALKQAINAQDALATFSDDTSAYVEGLRLVEFARSLGIAGPFPAFEQPGADLTPVPQSPLDQSLLDGKPNTGDAVTTDTSSNVGKTPAAGGGLSQPVISELSSLEPAGDSSVTQVVTAATGNWLSTLPDDAWLILLAAVNQRAAADRQINQHPDAGLQIIPAADDASPKFRIVKGPYPDQPTAKAAFITLPESLKGAHQPLYRTVSALRATLPTSSQHPLDQRATAAVAQYTLQLFASGRRDNADRLIEQYPALSLRIHAGEQFRVLYGNFDSVNAAKEAMNALPAALLRATGKPLLKPSNNPDGAAVSWGE